MFSMPKQTFAFEVYESYLPVPRSFNVVYEETGKFSASLDILYNIHDDSKEHKESESSLDFNSLIFKFRDKPTTLGLNDSRLSICKFDEHSIVIQIMKGKEGQWCQVVGATDIMSSITKSINDIAQCFELNKKSGLECASRSKQLLEQFIVITNKLDKASAFEDIMNTLGKIIETLSSEAVDFIKQANLSKKDSSSPNMSPRKS